MSLTWNKLLLSPRKSYPNICFLSSHQNTAGTAAVPALLLLGQNGVPRQQMLGMRGLRRLLHVAEVSQDCRCITTERLPVCLLPPGSTLLMLSRAKHGTEEHRTHSLQF